MRYKFCIRCGKYKLTNYFDEYNRICNKCKELQPKKTYYYDHDKTIENKKKFIERLKLENPNYCHSCYKKDSHASDGFKTCEECREKRKDDYNKYRSTVDDKNRVLDSTKKNSYIINWIENGKRFRKSFGYKTSDKDEAKKKAYIFRNELLNKLYMFIEI